MTVQLPTPYINFNVKHNVCLGLLASDFIVVPDTDRVCFMLNQTIFTTVFILVCSYFSSVSSYVVSCIRI